jgi:alkanesulfonate monooxygenase SsuD/methylene tetrahydromethanopterin reductase-like flavin-dependent oxidoreductase (luciferase family)
MNAGQSGAGQAFAMRNCDAFFTSTSGVRLAAAGTSQAVDEAKVYDRIVKQVNDIKAEGLKCGREIEVYTQGQVICRPTQKEADDYHHYANIENADWGAIDRMLALKNVTPQSTPADEFAGKRTMLASSGIGGYPFVGTPDKIAAELANLGRAGFRGLALSFVNYLNEVPYFCAEVLPRLARMGLRVMN